MNVFFYDFFIKNNVISPCFARQASPSQRALDREVVPGFFILRQFKVERINSLL